ncbi:Adenylate cyclase type 2 [Acipenser ruthenus]|uniref:Adenylate cyclase type 2 n=1 Tax=Acipenser ruthenus TaxID=7906 RepID=A0A444TXH7_ACIRT|nr:Adenylate cyclase type 2 [Acipenser ruthenus]
MSVERARSMVMEPGAAGAAPVTRKREEALCQTSYRPMQQQQPASLFTLLIILGFSLTLVAVFFISQRVAFFLFITIIVYTLLPLCLKYALIGGVVTSLAHIIVFSIYVPVTNHSIEHLELQLLSNAVVFICANLVGVYHKTVTERALQNTCRDGISFRQSRSKLVSEKKQQ